MCEQELIGGCESMIDFPSAVVCCGAVIGVRELGEFGGYRLDALIEPTASRLRDPRAYAPCAVSACRSSLADDGDIARGWKRSTSTAFAPIVVAGAADPIEKVAAGGQIEIVSASAMAVRSLRRSAAMRTCRPQYHDPATFTTC
jgi:hypothetical protein